MALSARDLYFAVRVEDRATRPLRRIAADMRALGKTGLAARQQAVASANVAQQRAASARRAALLEYASVRSGRARLSLESQQIKAANQVLNSKIKEAGVEQEIRRNYEQRLGQTVKISQIERALAQNRGVRRGVTVPETRVLREQALSGMATLNRQQEILAQRAGISPQAIDAAQARVKELEAAEAELASREQTLKGRVRASSDAYRLSTSRFREATAALKAFPVEKIQTVGTAAGHAGRALAFLGAASTAALGFAGKAAADFSTQVTIAATQSTIAGRNSVRDVQKNAGFIQAAIQRMLAGGRVIAGPQEQTSAVYRIFSGLTLKGNQLSQLRQGIGLLREFNRVTTANAGLVTLEEATRAGIILINRFGVSTRNIRPSLNIMQAAVRYGDMTMSEFIGTLNQMAPAAQAAGYNFTEMSGAAAFLSRQFPSLRQGATGYARLIEVFSRKDIRDGLERHGVAITHVVNGTEKLIPINQIAHRVIDRFGGSIKQGSVFLQNFFKEMGKTQGTIQARKVLESYVHRIGLADTILRQVARDHKELEKSLAAAQASPGVRWKEFTIQLQALALEIGTGVIPAVAHLAGYVQGLAEWFNQLSPHTKEMVGRFALFTAVAVTLGGVLLTVVGGLLSLRIVATQVASVFGLGLSASAGSAKVELALVLAGVVLLSAALQHFHGFRSAFGNNLGTILRIAGALLTLRLAVVGMVGVTNLLTATSIRFGLVGLASWSAGFAVLLPSIAIFVAALIGMQVGIAYLESEMAKSVQYYEETNGHIRRATKEHEKEARAVGEATANYNEYLRAIRQVGSVGPEGPIIPGGGIELHPGARSAMAHGDSPRFGFGKTVDQAQLMVKAAKKAALDLGVSATPSFRKLFDNLVAAKRHYNELKAAHADAYKLNLAQIKVGEASAALTANASAQQVAAAQKASTDAARLATQHQKHSDRFVINEARKVAALSKTARHEKTFAAWKAYYSALDKLQADASTGQMSAVEKMFNLTDSAADKTTAKAKKHAKDIRDTYQQVLQNLQSQYQTFYQQNQNAFGQLFQGPFMQSNMMQSRIGAGEGFSGRDIIRDLRSQLSAFRSWRRDLDKLQAKGLPQNLIDQIASLGPEQAKKQVEALNRLTPGQLREYGRLWKTGQQDIHKATLRDLNNQLASWRRHGRRIALAIAAGLRDENTALEVSLRRMIERAFPELAGHNRRTPARNHPRGVTSTGTSGPKHETHTHTHYHVTTQADTKDVKGQLKDANWHHRNRGG
jgi:hypothetical protein